MQGLFTYDLDSNSVSVRPQLVKTFENKSFKKWQFCLRASVQWSDGRPLLAQHFVDGWQRLLAPETASPSAHQFFHIKGAKEFNSGNLGFEQVGIKPTSSQCFAVELQTADPDFPSLLSAPYTYPIRKEIIAAHPNTWTHPENWVGLGPYNLANGDLKQTLLLEKNAKHWSKKPFIENIEIQWIEDKNTAVRLFRKKKIDLVKSPDFDQVQALNLEKYYVTQKGVGIYFLGFNLTRTGVQDRALRQRIKRSIDYTRLQQLFGHDVTPTKTIVPWSIFNDTPLPVKTTNAPSSKSSQPQKLVLYSNNSPLHKKTLEHINYVLKKNYDISSEIKLSDAATYFSDLRSKYSADLYRLSWTPAQITPMGFLKIFAKDSANNFSHYRSDTFNKQLSQYWKVSDPKQRRSIEKKLEQQLLHNDLVVIPLFRHIQSYLLNSEKFDYTPHFSERLEFARILPTDRQ